MDLQQEYKQLIQDALTFLKKEKKSFCYGAEEEIKRFYSAAIVAKPFIEKKFPKLPEKKKVYTAPVKPKIVKKTDPTTIAKKEKIIEKKIIPKEEKPKKRLSNPVDNMQDIKELLQKVAPEVKLYFGPIDDTKAKHLSRLYKYKSQAADISLLIGNEIVEHFRFFKNLSYALNKFFLPSRLVDGKFLERENEWETFLSSKDLKFIIVGESLFKKLKKLQIFFKEDKEKQSFYLKDKELFLLPDISLYLKEPTLKAFLWKTLSMKLKSYKDL